MSDPITRLAELFAEFPGVGIRQSKRFAHFLIRKDRAFADELAERIKSVRSAVSFCPDCFVVFETDGHDRCETCESQKTDRSMIMVVEKDADCESVKKSRTYPGRYFILGGVVNLLDQNGANTARTKELARLAEREAAAGTLKEVILALSAGAEGDYTDHHIRRLLAPLQERYGFAVSSLGRGLSTGTELEYSDNDTIRNALKNRG